MQVDDLLWEANMPSAERPWSRWLKGAAGTAGFAALALLVTAGNGGVDGVLFRIALCGTALAFVIWAVLLVRDFRSLVDVRVVGGENPQLRMTTTAGRIVTRAAEDVTRVELVFTPWPEESIGSDGQLRLELKFRRGVLGRRGRWCGTTTEEIRRTMDLWQRVCPAATVTKTVRLMTPGTGD
ncbi:hypothetical protein ACFOOM_23255 [Streptomyces echinoruber]|uniref:Uncharacterized protein n=1 Tax=Streptomyces echinoruber TaxID=68898 RepID=A0A918VF71_9ACTN|nr:hypothetical protein [Streptomyces echinoruber]GGZ92149.1 hypothetical protein GCM10010389_33430 [Streptomyces echinoruber]